MRKSKMSVTSINNIPSSKFYSSSKYKRRKSWMLGH